VRWHAVLGIAQNLSTTDRAFATRCINALAMEATLSRLRGTNRTEFRMRNAAKWSVLVPTLRRPFEASRLGGGP